MTTVTIEFWQFSLGLLTIVSTAVAVVLWIWKRDQDMRTTITTQVDSVSDSMNHAVMSASAVVANLASALASHEKVCDQRTKQLDERHQHSVGLANERHTETRAQLDALNRKIDMILARGKAS